MLVSESKHTFVSFLLITQHFLRLPAERKAQTGVSWPPCPQLEGGGPRAPPGGRLSSAGLGWARLTSAGLSVARAKHTGVAPLLSVTSFFSCHLCALPWPSCTTEPNKGKTQTLTSLNRNPGSELLLPIKRKCSQTVMNLSKEE